ncbi:MAG: hypothetical protein U0V75_00080 [Ferruginibacter sp.]
MDIKDIIGCVTLYLGVKFIDKCIEDNIPNLHYKRLIHAWKRIQLPVFLLSYIGCLYVIVKVTGDKQLEKNFNTAVLVAALAIVADQILQKSGNQVSLGK